MTRKQIEGLVAAWVPRLGLAHWGLKVVWDDPPSGTASAHVKWAWSYDTATLHFAKGYEKWSPAYAEWTIVHELVHLIMRDLDVAVAETLDVVSTPARRLARARYDHEAEGVVDRVAEALVKAQHAGRGN